MTLRLALAAALAAALPAPAAALEWEPVASAEALGGAHRAAGDGSFSGNADALFAPAARLGGDWTLVPSVRAAYEGTRRVDDALGTATPAQESLEARVAARAVWSPPGSAWRLKPGASLKQTFLKETRDESWGSGLFDERLWTVGGEAERVGDGGSSARASLDWFDASYPNYTSLESQAALQVQGRPLARELVGDRVLDRSGVRVAAGGERALGARLRGEAAVSTQWARYPRQRVVDEGGQLGGGLREDFLSSVRLTARMPRDWNADLRALGSLTVAAAVLDSSQNGYDASRGLFLPRSYDYRELAVTPGARLLVGDAGRPVTVDVTLGWRRRWYPRRPAQDGAGAYGGAPLRTTEWLANATVSYPLSGRFSVVGALERASATSNQRFERFYRYAYEAVSALAGVRWDW